MSEEDITRITVDPNNLPKGKTDWDKLDNLSEDELVQSASSDDDARIMTGEELSRMQRSIDVKHLRKSLDLSQQAFADTFHISCRTLQDWEQHRTTPDRTALAYLTAIKNNPHAIIGALNNTSENRPGS